MLKANCPTIKKLLRPADTSFDLLSNSATVPEPLSKFITALITEITV